ncbi:hypothetical protein HAX54_010720 [Datura stramonium]|uniref:Uncharacterized protein n=1 Tax=Datura stramonium TaxID=4076 RepID=A0ABS8WW31_DATST|nr:hypothetical protein [Datura stramonium]
MWLPPKPEDEEDEKKALIYDDDDDGGDDVGEWGLWSSRSFESGEYRSRDRPNEEQENVVKNVVDGHFRALGMDHLKMVVAKIDVHQPMFFSWKTSYRCSSCEMPSKAHVQCYTHRQGTLTISVKKFQSFFRPVKGTKYGCGTGA